MNKKLSSALLFGALLMASTSVFVSCKDYDDDVKDLQTQINNLTSAVGQKETTINNSIVNLRTAITALEAMEEAYKKADAAVLAEAKDAVAKAEAALKAAYESGDAATLNAAKAALAEAEAALKTAYQNADAEVLAAAQKAVNDAKSALEGEMSAADAATLASALEAVSDAKTSLQSEMAAADANTLAAAKEAVNQAKAALEAAINANYETLVAKDAELSAAILSAQTAVDQAMTLLGSKADKTELASVNNELQNTIQSLNTLNSTVSGAVTDIKSLQTALAAQEAALNAQKAELQNQIDAQSAALGQTNEKMAAALEQINTLQTTLAEKEAALRQAIADEAARISTELNNMGVSIEELRAAHETFTLKEETAIIRTDVAKIQQDTEALAMSIDEIDAKLDMLSKLLAQNLRSLVYMPKLYMDGIETIEYPWLTDTILMKQTLAQYVRAADGKTIKSVEDWVNTVPIRTFTVSPVWPIDYHMNPSISATKAEDVKGFYGYKVETITRATSNQAGSLGITSPAKYLDNTNLFANSNGILTTGLKINNAANIKNEKDGTENVIVALQVESRTSADKDTLITSDYAMIYPEKTWVEGLVWTKTGLNIGSPINKDEACTINAAQVVHVFDNPVEALEDIKNEADVQLMYNNRAGINLSEYLGLHYVIEGITKSAKAKRPGTWKFGEQTKWGLYYYFDLVDYEVDGNVTRDSRYLKINATTGNIVAQNVDDNGNILDVESATSVGREPLVRVRVYYADAPQTFANATAAETYLANHTVVDGYILVHITQTAPTPDPAQQLIIRDFFNKDENNVFHFNLCDGDMIWDSDWAEFSYFVLTTNLQNMTKEQFDLQYEPDFSDATNNKLAIFKKSGTGFTTTGAYGDAIYSPNSDTQTNHCFELNLSNTEMEQLTQHQTPWNNVVRDSLFIRYKAIAGTGAKYEYIYIKMPVTIDRKQGPESTLKNKNAEYWYKIDGTDNGWDAIIFNVNQPVDGRNTTVFNRSIKSTFLGPNNVTFGGNALNAYKFFFAPIETTVAGYTITPQKSASDANYNRFICKYHVDGTTVHKWGTAAQNKEIMQKCAIAYNEGVFTNKELYAKKGTSYIKIADMNQVTGEINLIQNDVAKEVLNAIGYVENNANVNTELRTYVAVVGTSAAFCNDLAAYVYEQSDDKSEAFLVSWARPINMVTEVPAPIADAYTNGQTIYVLELLKFYDFRGPVAGDMEGANKWMWAYYNIKGLKIDARLDQVYTNMGQANASNFVKLSTVTNDLKFGILTGTNSYSNSVFSCDFATILPGYRNNYNAASKSADLLADMGLSPVDRDKQAPFGVLYYENMGDKVTQFDVKVPVTVEYEWGSFTTNLTIHIDRTLGN